MSVTNDDDIQTASNIAIIEGLMTKFGADPITCIDRFYDTCKDRLGSICDMHLSMEDGNMNDDCNMSDVRKLIQDVRPRPSLS